MNGLWHEKARKVKLKIEFKICGDANGAHIHEYLKMPVVHTYEKTQKDAKGHIYGDVNGTHI